MYPIYHASLSTLSFAAPRSSCSLTSFGGFNPSFSARTVIEDENVGSTNNEYTIQHVFFVVIDTYASVPFSLNQHMAHTCNRGQIYAVKSPLGLDALDGLHTKKTSPISDLFMLLLVLQRMAYFLRFLVMMMVLLLLL